MKKRFWIISVVIIFILMGAIPREIRAFDGKKHNEYLIQVLFGSSAVTNTDIMDALNISVALAVDQHGNSGQDQLDELRKYGIKGLPKKVSEFNVGHGYLHRNYTHKGWNYDYKSDDNYKKDEAHWNDIRKNIILKTVNQVFDFGFFSGKFGKYNSQCDAFAAYMYYVHVLGDHISNEEHHANYDEIPLVKGSENKGIIEELLIYAPKLFVNQVDNKTYYKFINELEDLKNEIEEIYYYPDDLVKEEVYEMYHQYANELMECLIDYIPLIIKKETFFKEAFYSKEAL